MHRKRTYLTILLLGLILLGGRPLVYSQPDDEALRAKLAFSCPGPTPK